MDLTNLETICLSLPSLRVSACLAGAIVSASTHYGTQIEAGIGIIPKPKIGAVQLSAYSPHLAE